MDKLKAAGIENVSMVTEPLERSARPNGKSSKMKTAREKFDRWIVASVALHVSVVLLCSLRRLFLWRTPSAGASTSGTGGVNVKIVNGVPGISLPAPPPTARRCTE
jgi:hypothetical protein